MGTLRFADIQTRPTEVLDLTGLTVVECRELVPPFEAAFQTPMAAWRLDGQSRTARRYTTDTNCPLPTPEDRLLLIRVSLQMYPRQVVQGRLFGMGQSQAHPWIHVLFVGLRATLRPLGDAPTRVRAGVSPAPRGAEAKAAALVMPTAGPSTPTDPPAAMPAPASPLFATMGPSGASRAPRIRLSTRTGIAARTSAIP